MSLTIRPIDQIEERLLEAAQNMSYLARSDKGFSYIDVCAWSDHGSPSIKLQTTNKEVFLELVDKGGYVKRGEFAKHPTIDTPTWFCHASKTPEGWVWSIELVLKVEVPGWQDGDEEPSL